MRLGIVVNVMGGAPGGQTTYRIATRAVRRGHEVWMMSGGRFEYAPNDQIRALASRLPAEAVSIPRLEAASGNPTSTEHWVTVDDLDVLLLRNNPAAQNPWAQFAGVQFGRLAARHGVIVLNDPNGLAKAMNKLYLQTFPPEVRPVTLVTRSRSRIFGFARSQGTIVIKPLMGSGGASVFVVRPEDLVNLDQMIDAVSRDGYVIAQEYLPAAAAGDTRLFLMNGEPLRYRNRFAAFRRVPTGDDMRSNVQAGGRLRRAIVDDSMLQLADIVRPRLVEDGMFLVGLDIVGDRLMEINVFSPGGLGSAEKFEKVDFCDAVIDSLERKVRYMKYYRRSFGNIEMATL